METTMVLYIYSDESGVLDKAHNSKYVFGGLICVGKDGRDLWARKYSAAEKVISKSYEKGFEIKATHISNKEKGKLYRSLNNCYKFGVVIDQSKIHDRIFDSKKSKQRFLNFAYKIAVKRAFENMASQGTINPDDITDLIFRVDEHTTATDGRYELREALEQEFKIGTFNWKYDKFYPPIFKNLKSVTLEYCNSEKVLLVRAADIIANNIYHHAIADEREKLIDTKYLHITTLPLEKK